MAEVWNPTSPAVIGGSIPSIPSTPIPRPCVHTPARIYARAWNSFQVWKVWKVWNRLDFIGLQPSIPLPYLAKVWNLHKPTGKRNALNADD